MVALLGWKLGHNSLTRWWSYIIRGPSYRALSQSSSLEKYIRKYSMLKSIILITPLWTHICLSMISSALYPMRFPISLTITPCLQDLLILISPLFESTKIGQPYYPNIFSTTDDPGNSWYSSPCHCFLYPCCSNYVHCLHYPYSTRIACNIFLRVCQIQCHLLYRIYIWPQHNALLIILFNLLLTRFHLDILLCWCFFSKRKRKPSNEFWLVVSPFSSMWNLTYYINKLFYHKKKHLNKFYPKINIVKQINNTF